MIRANGLELMNGAGSPIEVAFGVMAAKVARQVTSPHILLGGLGLGYTLGAPLSGKWGMPAASRLPSFPRPSSPGSIDMSPHQYCRIGRRDVTIVALDIGSMVRTEDCRAYDVIALDVDNGPEALVSPENAQLYGPAGLHALAARLEPGGVILLWSGFESPAFAEMAEKKVFR